MDWKKGFRYVFEDRRWAKKMFIGALVTSVPVVESISNGYQMQVIENIKAGNPRPLPDWSNMDQMFGKGFKLWAAVNMFYIPSTILTLVSWFLGFPLVLGSLAVFIASLSANDVSDKDTIYYLLVHVIFPLIELVVSGTAVLLGSIALPVVFFFVPAMALRCQETGSFLSTLNIVAHIRFILKNLGDYVISRVLIAGMLVVMHIIASIAGGATVWIAGLGILLAWFLGAAGRFWSRLAWAYFLANMRMREHPLTGGFDVNRNYQNLPFATPDTPTLPLTPMRDREHYWGTNS